MAKSGGGCTCCRVMCVALLLLLLAGGGGIGVYFAVDKSGAPDLDETANSVAETKESGKSKAKNFGEKDDPVDTVNRFYGMSYSPFGLGDNQLCPKWKKVGGLCILADQVKADMRQIAQLTTRVKTYSLNCLPQTKVIVDFAMKHGMTIMLGVWVDKSEKLNDIEIKRLVELLAVYKSAKGTITEIIVGNEALFVQKATEKELLRMIKVAKDAVAGAGLKIPVGTAEIYQIWSGDGKDSKSGKPLTAIAKAVDFIGLNTHAYYAGVDPLGKKAAAGKHVLNEQMGMEAFWKKKGINRRVVISETGFPTKGPPNPTQLGTSKPSVAALSAFAEQMEEVSRENDMPYYFFEPYNGDWKRRWLPYTELDYSFGLHTCDRVLKKGLKLPSVNPN